MRLPGSASPSSSKNGSATSRTPASGCSRSSTTSPRRTISSASVSASNRILLISGRLRTSACERVPRWRSERTAVSTESMLASAYPRKVSSLFCRHNRFTADCPICSKNTVLAREAPERARPPKPSSSRSGGRKGPSRASAPTITRYPHVSIGPVEHEARIYEVRLEQVPGGLRLGQWRAGELERKAPVVSVTGLRQLFDEARGRGLVKFDLPEGFREIGDDIASSPGRAGDMQEELRLERVDDPGFVRIARWIFWPGTGVGWELQDAPVMLPEKRYEQVLSDAAVKGLI